MTHRILIVDDSSMNRSLTRVILERDGYEVLEAVDGQDAIDLLTGSPLDLIICDFNMPRVNGFGVIEAVRRHPVHQQTPIVMLSSEVEHAIQQKAFAMGATAWVLKSCPSHELSAIVKSLLSDP